MNDKETQEHLRRVCLICHKKVSEHSLNDLLSCINEHSSQERYLEKWAQAMLDKGKNKENLEK